MHYKRIWYKSIFATFEPLSIEEKSDIFQMQKKTHWFQTFYGGYFVLKTVLKSDIELLLISEIPC